MISRAMDYALRALTCMARKPPEQWMGAQAIAQEVDASAGYLGKVLQQLVGAGLLESTPGPGGGYRFAISPDEIRLIHVLHIVDGHNFHTACILGLGACSESDPCPLHDTWSACRDLMVSDFARSTIRDAARKGWLRER